MKYKIYQLEESEILSRMESARRYESGPETILLKEMGFSSGLSDEYNSHEEAISNIIKNKEDLKQKTLTILPIIKIGWDGEIH